MDFTIRLRAEGTSETRAQAEAVKAVRTELEKTQKKVESAKFVPRKVREAKEDRELDRAADRAAKALIKEDKEREKAEAKAASEAAKRAARESAAREKQRASVEKDNAKRAAMDAAAREKQRVSAERENARRASLEVAEVARKAALDARRLAAEEKAQKSAEAAKAKSDQRALEQKRKATEREDKEIDRAAKNAQKALIKDDKEREKAKKDAAKKADEEMAARIDPSLKKLSATEKAKEKLFGKIGTGVMLAGAAAGAALVGVTAKLAPLALGYMGMARLSMISAQAGFNMRRLFMGTNPRPLLDALQRTGQLIDPRTFTGKTLGDLLTRSANGVFSLLAKAEPYARLFFKGMLLGALQVENAWLRLRIAIQPALNLLPPGIGLMTTFSAGALAVKAAFGLMGVGVALGIAKAATGLVSFGVSALAATGPLLPLTAAIVGVGLAISQLKELVDQWDDNSLSLIGKKLEEDFTSDEYKAKKQKAEDVDRQGRIGARFGRGPLMIGGVGATAPQATPVPKGAEKQAAAAGPPIGKNLGLGIIAGMKDTQAKVEAGGRDLVLAAEGGAKKEAVIKSPSEKWRKQIGRQLGAGAALGLEDSADRIDEAARAAVPGAPGVGGIAGRRGASVVVQQIGPFYGVGAEIEATVRRIVPDVLDDLAERVGALA